MLPGCFAPRDFLKMMLPTLLSLKTLLLHSALWRAALLKEGVLLLPSLRLLYKPLYGISAGVPATVPSLHAPGSSLLADAINGCLLDTF